MQSENANTVPKPPKPDPGFLDRRMTDARAYSLRQRMRPKPQDIVQRHKAEAPRPASFAERIRAAKDVGETKSICRRRL